MDRQAHLPAKPAQRQNPTHALPEAAGNGKQISVLTC